ncbi:N-acetylmannosamine-6-phosphate 2-epimerase [Pedococcus sp. 5OH_020]|uniref:N-acetylmannosamine-6-phosphate 2-epimerase n=1 Tax=Pedococcus sp. 5OH_020 TaxID=2989814 RepID=UPI0022E9E28F|nr:putative N-acetylmannosamine-6-phosphate 2-epimerase [Pedococcus sp. 5OH_020]
MTETSRGTRTDPVAEGPLPGFKGGLVVSCQARDGHPLHRPDLIAVMARCAEAAGAVGLRICGEDDIRAVKKATSLPVIGLEKVDGGHRLLITPTYDAAARLVEAGADVVALEVTSETSGDGAALVQRVAERLGVPVMADVSTVEEGLLAWQAGAAVIGTTLSGYTLDTGPMPDEPDVDLVTSLHKQDLTVAAEGRYRTAYQVAEAFDAGASFVVVGGAITDPVAIARRLVAATPMSRQEGTSAR